jgi:hypothetical protein
MMTIKTIRAYSLTAVEGNRPRAIVNHARAIPALKKIFYYLSCKPLQNSKTRDNVGAQQSSKATNQ